MDVNKTLRELRDLTDALAHGYDQFWAETDDVPKRVSELFRELDAHLSAGNPNPDDWGGFGDSDCEICQEDIDLDSLEPRDLPSYADPADTVDDGA